MDIHISEEAKATGKWITILFFLYVVLLYQISTGSDLLPKF